MKGSRVQSVVRELGGERIDVVLWNDDLTGFVTRALSPAKVVHAEMDDADNKATVVVADDQLSLAIGKGGQNARLAAKLTNLKIDLINESQHKERLEFQKMARVPISELLGIDDETRSKLAEAGYETVHDLSKAEVGEVAALEGVGEEKAGEMIGAAKARIAEIRDRSKGVKPAGDAVQEGEPQTPPDGAEGKTEVGEAGEAES
jgi:N utilization substance protein A